MPRPCDVLYERRPGSAQVLDGRLLSMVKSPAFAKRPEERSSRWPIVRATVVCSITLLLAGDVLLPPGVSDVKAPNEPGSAPAFDAERAWGYLLEICKLGSRTSGTDGME